MHERYADVAASPGAVRLYSQGKEGDFADIAAEFPGIEMHLDEDPIGTIRGLANARNLVMAKSSFSYIAALLCPGRVFYDPFWHAPLSDWVRLK